MKRIDALGILLERKWRHYWNKKIAANSLTPLRTEIAFLQQLAIKLRGGISLHNSLQDPKLTLSPNLREQVTRALDYEETKASTVLESIFHSSLRNGNPCLPALQFYKSIQEQRLRSEQKKRSSSTQARLQAYLICIVPWLLLFSLFLTDPTLLAEQSTNSLCLALWFLSLFLDVIGILWIRKILRSTFVPTQISIKEIEEDLMEFLFRLLPLISAGVDVREACTRALTTQNNHHLSIVISSLDENTAPNLPEEFFFLREILKNSLHFGSPVKEELRTFLEEIQYKKERRWEEALQKLPIRLMAPLFLCIFLAALAVLFSLVVPFANAL